MKSARDMIREQSVEVAAYRQLAQRVANERLAPLPTVIGVLLTGSVARGDARKGPLGLNIDITIVVSDRKDINLTEVFGPSIDPYIPFHCVNIERQGFAFEVLTTEQLSAIQTCPESVIFAKNEGIILFDRTGWMYKWKAKAFLLSEEQIRRRALQQYFRFDYLTNEYRVEKWKYRESWVQMTQNGNEALECYCNFLYCVNGWFIPRKDWLVYLTTDLPDKASDHEQLMNSLYMVEPTEESIRIRTVGLRRLGSWMREYCVGKGWLETAQPVNR